MKYLIRIVFLAAFVLAGGVQAENLRDAGNNQHYIQVPKGQLASFFKWHEFRRPLISHHRGGPRSGFPENSIEAMSVALRYGPGLMEVDVAQLRDGTLILMHDNRLDRTTTGTGNIANVDWAYVERQFLRDNSGSLTKYRIPKLKNVLLWAKGKAILTLDVKRGTSFKKIAELVEDTGTEDYVVGITYSLKQAQAFHRMAPRMPLTITMYDEDDIVAVKKSGIPSDLVIAWTGTRISSSAFYTRVHSEGWSVVMGTLGPKDKALDFEYERTNNDAAYIALYKMGIDIIATDRYWAVQPLIQTPDIFYYTPVKSRY